jgi:hypothetical protein
MIVITKIEVEEVSGISREMYSQLPLSGYLDGVNTTLRVETINGSIFRRPDGSTINIGTSKQAQEVIGIQYEDWRNMEQELTLAGRKLFNMHSEKKLFDEMGLWQRLKWALKC